MKTSIGVQALAAALLIAAPAWAQDSAAPAPSSSPAASSTQAAPPASATPSAPEAAAGGAASQSGALTIDAPPAGKGRVVFYRSSFMGVAIGCAVHENGETLSRLPYGKYFFQDFAPGVHTFLTESESKQTLRMEVEDGETYYVKCTIAMGIIVGRPNLSPSDKATFDKASKSLKLQAPPQPKAS